MDLEGCNKIAVMVIYQWVVLNQHLQEVLVKVTDMRLNQKGAIFHITNRTKTYMINLMGNIEWMRIFKCTIIIDLNFIYINTDYRLLYIVYYIFI